MPQFLYRIQPTRPAMLTEGLTETEAQVMAYHFAYLQELLADGKLILAGRTQNTDPSTMGIAIFWAGSEREAQAIMEQDPAVQQGVMHATLFPYRVALIAEANAQAEAAE